MVRRCCSWFILFWFDGAVIQQQLQRPEASRCGRRERRNSGLSHVVQHWIFFSREAFWHCMCWLTSHVAVHKKNPIRLRDKCALRRWQRRWLSLSAHFNQPLLLSRGWSLQIQLPRSRNIGSFLCAKVGAIFFFAGSHALLLDLRVGSTDLAVVAV
jgi:hypothetical protein